MSCPVTLANPDTVANLNFPISSSNATVTDAPDALTLTGFNVAPSSIGAGTDNAFLRLAPSVNQDNGVWTGLVTHEDRYRGDHGPGQRDRLPGRNSDNVWQATDTVVGFASNPAASPVTVTFGSAQTITTSAQPTYFVVLSPKATATGTVGASIAADADITIQGTTDTRTRAGTTASGNATITGDTTPPLWNSTQGVQVALGAGGSAKLLFNGATDAGCRLQKRR